MFYKERIYRLEERLKYAEQEIAQLRQQTGINIRSHDSPTYVRWTPVNKILFSLMDYLGIEYVESIETKVIRKKRKVGNK